MKVLLLATTASMMVFAALSDTVLTTIVMAIAGVLVAYLENSRRTLNDTKNQIDKTVVKAEEVSVEVKETKKVAKDTRQLVDGARLAHLKLVAELTRWKADQGTDSGHIKAAEDAEKAYRAHEARLAKLYGQMNKEEDSADVAVEGTVELKEKPL